MTHPDDAIGGYFGLEMARGTGMPWLAGAARYQSARAAIGAALHGRGIIRAWVPHFVCSAVTDALVWLGVEVCSYALGPGRRVPAALGLSAGDVLVCVDYFGLGAAACDEAITRYGADRVLVDASQALFHRPRAGVATVYSPRKFVGVPDGGLLANGGAAAIVAAPANESASIERSRHLLLRAAGLVEPGYTQFQAAEASLEDCRPASMSQLTAALLDAIDFAQVHRRRVANYERLAAELGGHGYAIEPLPADAVPLCCPVLGVNAPHLRRELAGRRIFTPTYWPDAVVPADDVVGQELRERTVYLPCDQRYDGDDMMTIARSFFDLGGSA